MPIFAAHESTVANARRQYHHPRILQRLSRGTWQHLGRPDVIQQAWVEYDKLAEEFDFEPPQDIIRDLERIYARAKAKFGS